jgi:heme A synthase
VILGALKHDPVTVILHQGFASVVLIYSIFMALWGLFLYARSSGPSGGYLGALILNEAVIILQALIGVVLLTQGHRPAQSLHYLYGVALFLTLPAAYLYSDRGETRRDSLVFGVAAIVLAGLTIRAMTTGTS